VRYAMGLLVGLVAIGLVGCSGGGSLTAARRSLAHVARAQHAAAHPTVAGPRMQAGARAAAVRFDAVYLASQFATSWQLLSPEVKRQIRERVWVAVHDRCRPADSGKARVISAVTVFGDTAIVTERIGRGSAKLRRTEDVFGYVNGRWGYAPEDVGLYLKKSVAADVAAAKAAGYCGSWKDF
jgi:hypothetical protein